MEIVQTCTATWPRSNCKVWWFGLKISLGKIERVHTPIRFTRPNTALYFKHYYYTCNAYNALTHYFYICTLYLLTPHTTTLTSPRSSPTNTILLDGKTSMQVIFPLNFPLLPVLPPFINKLRVTNSFHFPTFE
jgi:hypothetical protein